MNSEEDIVEYRGPTSRNYFGKLVAVFIFNLVLSGLLLGYGAILSESVRQDVDIVYALAVPVFLVGSYSIAQSWCREAADSFGSTIGYRTLATVGLLFVFAGILSCVVIPQNYYALTYGILSGIGTCLVIAQIDALLFEIFDTKLGLVRGLCFCGQAMAQIVFPHILTALIDKFGHQMQYLILSAIVLQTLPLVCFFKTEETIQRPYEWSRYSDYSRNDSIFSFDVSDYTNDIQLKEFWPDEFGNVKSKDKLYFDKSRNKFTTVTPPPSPEEKRRNPYGVELLPDIPEENEVSESETNHDSRRNTLNNAIKRLSVMSDHFEEAINKTNRNEATTVEIVHKTVESSSEAYRETLNDPLDFRLRNSVLTMNRKLHLSPYKLYKLRRRLRYCLCWIHDIFIKPLTRSLLCWRFYPVLLLNFARLVSLVDISALLQLFTTTEPFLLSVNKGNYMVSLHGIGWICFLIFIPCISTIPKGNYKYLTVFGLLSSALGVGVICWSRTIYTLSVSCFLSGLGFGGISSTWESTAKEFLGIRDWSKVQSSLETLAGISIFVFFGVLAKLTPFQTTILLQLQILSVILAINACIWLIISISSALYSIKVKSINRGFLFD